MLNSTRLIFSILALAAFACHAQVQRCTIDKKIVYQDSPCAAEVDTPKSPNIVQKSGSAASRDELRLQAEAARERNAKELENIQRGFRSPVIAPLTPANLESREIPGTGLTQVQICKAAVASIFGRTPKSIAATRETDGVTYLSYLRASDNTRWSQKCRVVGKEIQWGTESGRWRDQASDGVLTYDLTYVSIVIRERHADNSMTQNSFAFNSL